MIDLTRALYLGLTHAHASLRPWSSLTTGRPVVLEGSSDLERRLADHVGLPAATLLPSTLHVVVDLFRALARRTRTIHVDACTYAVTRWALDHAAVRGVAVRVFNALHELDSRFARGDAIVSDAICVRCRTIKPLRALQRHARHGVLVIDDSQGIGILGARPSASTPYGFGGNGSLAWTATPTENVILIGTLAKAFGAPLAFFAASRETVAWFERVSGSRVHSSPCDAASLAAIDSALRTNRTNGDVLRRALFERVTQFRAAAASRWLAHGSFPVQTTATLPRSIVAAIDRRLRGRGIRVLRLRASRGAKLGFIINADHERAAIADAGRAIGELLNSIRPSDRVEQLAVAAAHAR